MKSDAPWYQKGLNFKCTECGKCCTGSPGYVWVNEEEIEKIASLLNISIKECKQRYVRKVAGRFSLVESKKNYDCIFLKENKCKIYKARPTQCRTFPWWPQHLSSDKSWKELAKSCEGVSPSAPTVCCQTIEEQKLIQIKRNKGK